MVAPKGLGPDLRIIERLRSLLLSRGYAPATVGQYVAALRRFQEWMESRGNVLEDVDPDSVHEYLSSTHSDGGAKGRNPLSPPNVRASLAHLLSQLGKADKVSKASPFDEELKAFGEHLASTCGLAPQHGYTG